MSLDFSYENLIACKCVDILEITSFGAPEAIFPIS
jgi:hypothetical protein